MIITAAVQISHFPHTINFEMQSLCNCCVFGITDYGDCHQWNLKTVIPLVSPHLSLIRNRLRSCMHLCVHALQRLCVWERKRERMWGGATVWFKTNPLSCCMFQLRSHSLCLVSLTVTYSVLLFGFSWLNRCGIRATPQQFRGNFFMLPCLMPVG